MTARILLVEDDPALLSILSAAIGFGGFTSDSVKTGLEALKAFERGGFDAVLMDLGLPDMDGGEVLTALRGTSDIPIIVVSGRGTERDKIQALDLGADDYIAKPFLPGELLARLRAALRRHRRSRGGGGDGEGGASPDAERLPVRLGSVTLDPLRRSAESGGQEVILNETEYKVMALLARERGSIVGRQEVLETLYGEAPPRETRIVDVYISNIRKKLAGLAGGEDLIATYRGRGWMIRRT
ncbi:MAG: two-component system, OmpR family, operon response regulator KdpE [Sphingomonadales bacterium]|jgi:DNA-binding response OmpR family regulator|nr:two-component system, OmpR family, operon response regulator KdpE [Sphingomonadales bacterium]